MNRSALGIGLMGALILTLGGFSTPPGPQPVRLVLLPGSSITIEGTSNLHDWSCTATTLKADIQVQVDDDGAPLPTVVDFTSIQVPVAGIDCKHDKMNENLAKALRARDNPTITFRAASPRALHPHAGRASATFRGELRVAGVVKTIDLPVDAAVSRDGTLRITGEKAFLMTQFDVKPPRAMLGTLKTANRVTVRFDLVASTANHAAAGSTSAAAR